MNRMRQSVMVGTMLLLAMLLTSCATIQPDDRIRAKVTEGSLARKGETIHLFYGMSKKAKEEFCQNAVVPVYRMGEGYFIIKTEVAKIKVTKDLGDHYIEAVVVEGEVKPGDIAMQPNSECLITVPQSR